MNKGEGVGEGEWLGRRWGRAPTGPMCGEGNEVKAAFADGDGGAVVGHGSAIPGGGKVEATAAGWVATIRDMVMADDLVGGLIVR